MTTGFIDWVWINQVLQRFRAKSPRTIFKPTLNTAVPSILVVAFILIIWAAVRYGEQTPNSDNVLCEPRAQEVGFIGDPDFYGLGIRLGLYLQWIAYLITAASLPKERRGVMVSYVIFNLSITVAIMVKVFSRECTLTVELFVVLVLFWGGINVVHIPLMQATFFNGLRKRFQEPQASRSNIIRAASWMTEASGKTSPIEPRIPRTSRWLLLISHLFNFLISPITIWYWTRLAVAGQTDFAPTPGGSAFFFFARIPESSFKSFSIFMAIASTMTFIKLVQAFLPTPYDFEENPKLSGLVWILLGIITSPLGFIMFFLRIIPMLLASGMSALYYWTHQDGDAFDDGDLRYPGISPLPGDIFVLIGTNLIISFLICIWCILAIELTLSWNTVSSVYSIDNTGQILPFVSGTGILLFTLWKCWQGHRRRKSKRKNRSEAGVSLEDNVHSSNNSIELAESVESTHNHDHEHEHDPACSPEQLSVNEASNNEASTLSAAQQENGAAS